jgi:hypothetical protein
MTDDTAIEDLTIETAPLGHTFTDKELQEQCAAIFGGVAWPGKHPGFAIVLALDTEEYLEGRHMHVLDEVESRDIGELIRRCTALDVKYKPKIWFGNDRNSAANRLIFDMMKQRQPRQDTEQQRPGFSVLGSDLLDLETPYSFMLAMLKDLLNEECRRLFIKDSRVKGHLAQIDQDTDTSALAFGEYPAIEALAFVVCEAKDYEPPKPEKNPYDRRPKGPMVF